MDFPQPVEHPGIPANGAPVVYGGDKGLNVRFYDCPVHNRTHVEIVIPGDDRLVLDKRVEESHKQRFPREWAAYQGEQSALQGQILLDHQTWVQPAAVKALAAKNIRTLEHAAGLSDATIAHLGMPGLREIRAKAQNELEIRQKASEYDEVRAELEQLRKQVAAKTSRVAKA